MLPSVYHMAAAKYYVYKEMERGAALYNGFASKRRSSSIGGGTAALHFWLIRRQTGRTGGFVHDYCPDGRKYDTPRGETEIFVVVCHLWSCAKRRANRGDSGR
jgi:hypothetical protein